MLAAQAWSVHAARVYASGERTPSRIPHEPQVERRDDSRGDNTDQDSVDSTDLLAVLSSWSDLAHDETKGFCKRFCPNARILTQVSWDSENMRFVYILDCGQHVADSVKISEWLEFLSTNKAVHDSCAHCGGDGIERCRNLDHRFIKFVGSANGGDNIHRLGCSECGHDELYRIRIFKDGKYYWSKCPECNNEPPEFKGVQKIKINTIEDNIATVRKNMEECFGKFEVLIKMEPEIDPEINIKEGAKGKGASLGGYKAAQKNET